MDAQLPGARPKHVTFDADKVAEVESLKQIVIPRGNRVFFYVNLDPLAVLAQVSKGRLTHPTDRVEAAAQAHAVVDCKLLGSFRCVVREQFWNGVGERERTAVGCVALGLKLAHAREALLQKIVFKRQMPSPVGNTIL